MTPWLVLGLCLVAVAVATILLSRKIDARMRQDIALDEIKREVGGIITELNQTTERNIALIEDRIGRLDEMRELADRRIGALQGLLDRDRLSQQTYSHLKQGSNRALSDESTEESPAKIEDESEPIRINFAPPQDEPVAQATGRVGFRDKVLQLHRDGLTVEAIAAQLGTTAGEVDLVISLDQR